MRMSVPSRILFPITLGLLIIFAGACVTTGTLTETLTDVVVDDSRSLLGLLEGKWRGNTESSGPSGSDRNSVFLEVKNGAGSFSLGSGETWDTFPRLSDRKVVMGFGYGYREFTLKRDDRGRYLLESRYDAYWKGELRTYHTLLRKL